MNNCEDKEVTIECGQKPSSTAPLWFAIILLALNNFLGCLPSLREYHMQQDINANEARIDRVAHDVNSMDKELDVIVADNMRVESRLVHTQAKVNGMEKSLTELVNQHKGRK